MSIFNSLGSNYGFSFVRRALFAPGKDLYKTHLKKFLEKKYEGKVYLTYKGREALTLALKAANLPKNSKVGITGFTCYAVWKAVEDVGCRAVYLDIDESLNFSAKELSKDLKAVIVQNTLGIACEINAILKFCKENKIILIEDLAHCIGTIYQNNKEAGVVGDFTVLSFSQDKIIDAVSGGALIIRNTKYKIDETEMLGEVSLLNQIRDRFYPLLTYLIRKTYFLGIGRLLHFLFKNLRLLSSPMDDNSRPKRLPNWYCYLAKYSFDKLEKNIKHRQKIAKLYINNLDLQMFNPPAGRAGQSNMLRFPIFIDNRDNLINYLKKYGIYISDTWYDVPIAPKKYLAQTDYGLGTCPNAEKIADRIVNLPTHHNVSEKQALYIAQKINEWLKLKK